MNPTDDDPTDQACFGDDCDHKEITTDKATGLPLVGDAQKAVPLFAASPAPRVVGRILVDDESCAGRGCDLEDIMHHEDFPKTAIVIHSKFSNAVGAVPLHAIIRSTDPLEHRLCMSMLNEILDEAGINASKLVGGGPIRAAADDPVQ